jgi:hypothetical protein
MEAADMPNSILQIITVNAIPIKNLPTQIPANSHA